MGLTGPGRADTNGGMRLFVAIVPPPAVLAELAAAVAPLRAGRPGLRWTGPADWHLTLAFLGEVDEAVLAGAEHRLERAARRHPGQRAGDPRRRGLPAAGQGHRAVGRRRRGRRSRWPRWPRRSRPRRAGPGAPPPDEGRRYRPHITLARCREPADASPS